MKIGWIMPGGFAVAPPGDGRKVQALRQVEALEALGHQVARLSPWEEMPEGLDALHIYEGAFSNIVGAYRRPPKVGVVSLATIIDSNMPYWAYRLAAFVGGLSGNLRTNQGLHRKQAQRSDVVIVRSRSERERVVRGLGVEPAKVQIVLNGMAPPAPVDAALARRRLGIAEDFVLHVSAYTDGRKNVVRLAEAINQTPYPLIIAGRGAPGAEMDRLKVLAASNPRVKLMGFVDHATLQDLYAACKVFALPSIHEGTGLVALEAAAHGASVVITKLGGPPDYFGDMVDYVDPFKVASIREGLTRAWERPRVDTLRQHVLAHLTWEASARSLVAAWEARMNPSSGQK